jgi:hypothetical protein
MRKSIRHSPGTLGTSFSGAPDTILPDEALPLKNYLLMNQRRSLRDETLIVAPKKFDARPIGLKNNAMKSAIIACALLLAGTFAAQAYHYETTYNDLVRPNGQPRGDATYNADLNFCYRQTGANLSISISVQSAPL